MFYRCNISCLFGTLYGFGSICVCHRFKVCLFDLVFFDFGAMLISIAGLDLTLKLLLKLLFKLLFKIVVIVVIVTVSFLNFILPFNIVLFCYLDSLYACLGVHTLRLPCVMVMFATKNGLWIPPSNSSSNPTKATMDPRV